MKTIEVKESAIQRAILDNLTWRGILCWRSQAIPVPIRRGRAILGLRRVDPQLIGMPDIMMLHLGRFVGIEVKSLRGRQRLEQTDWQAKIQRAGGRYILARSWDDVEKYLKDEIMLVLPPGTLIARDGTVVTL